MKKEIKNNKEIKEVQGGGIEDTNQIFGNQNQDEMLKAHANATSTTPPFATGFIAGIFTDSNDGE